MAPPVFVKLGAFLTVFAAVGSASTCPQRNLWTGLEGKTMEQHITVGGEERSYLMHIPQDFLKRDGKVGFVFSFHDQYKDAHHQEGLSSFSNPTYNNKYIAIYPQALNGTWHPGRSSGGAYNDTSTTNPQDHIFTSAILDKLYATPGLCPDETQAYATGMGNGSSFIHHLNCRNIHSHPFTAFASVAGLPQTLDMTPERCYGLGIRPLIMIHSTADREFTDLTDTTGTRLPHLSESNLALQWAVKAGGLIHDTPNPIVSSWSK
jgi:poly(3-hydroxybutyrate) depolymerase